MIKKIDLWSIAKRDTYSYAAGKLLGKRIAIFKKDDDTIVHFKDVCTLSIDGCLIRKINNEPVSILMNRDYFYIVKNKKMEDKEIELYIRLND